MRNLSVLENLINRKTPVLAAEIVEMQYAKNPVYWNSFGEKGRILSERDAAYHLPFLLESVVSGEPDIFRNYSGWVHQLFHSLGFAPDVFADTLRCTAEVLTKYTPDDLHESFLPVIRSGIEMLLHSPEPMQSFIHEDDPLYPLCHNYMNALLAGDRTQASRLIMQAVDQGTGIREIYMWVFQKSQYEIGRLWLNNSISVAKEHFCSAATQLIMSQLYPRIFSTVRAGNKMVAACVGGELHELGIRMVTDFFEMEGWDTYYLGANTPASSIIKAIEETGANVAGLSAAMPFHRRLLRDTIHQIRESSAGRDVCILIGGNAVNLKSEGWKDFGADGYAPDAEQAITVAKQLLNI